MAADYAALEARVAELEQQIRHILPAKIDAANYAISLVHQDTQQMRETLDIHTAALDRQERRLDRHGELLGSINDRLDRHGEQLTSHGELLAEILRRLPAGPPGA